LHSIPFLGQILFWLVKKPAFENSEIGGDFGEPIS
jgi:hypothetical protein